MEKYLTAKDIMKIFSCGKNRAYDIIRSEGFPTIQIGKRKYVPEEAFKKWEKAYLHKEFVINE